MHQTHPATGSPQTSHPIESLVMPTHPLVRPLGPSWEEREIDRLRSQLRMLNHASTEESRGELSAETRALAEEARKKGVRVEVETPVRWLNGKNGGAMCRQMYGELVTQIGRLGLSISAHPISKDKSLQPRPPKNNRLLFSYHTAGEGDHIWRIKESHIPPFFSWDRLGFSGWSTLAQSSEILKLCNEIDLTQASQFAGALVERVQRERITKYRQKGEEKIPTNHPYVFFAMQVPGDLVMSHGRLEQQALLRALIQVAEEQKSMLVIKQHPLCSCEKTRDALIEAQKSPYVRLCQGHIHDLIHNAQSVVVTNSGVGMEAVLQNKPVFTVGASDYRWATHEVGYVEELVSAFREPSPKLNPDQLNQFITLYFGAHCIDATKPKTIEGNIAIALKEWLAHAS
jgi:hypothetical protein